MRDDHQRSSRDNAAVTNPTAITMPASMASCWVFLSGIVLSISARKTSVGTRASTDSTTITVTKAISWERYGRAKESTRRIV